MATLGDYMSEPRRPQPIVVSPDKPALLAQRIMRRLVRDRLVPTGDKPTEKTKRDMITEAVADEIHQDILDATLRRGVGN